MSATVTLDDIRAAESQLSGVIVETPTVHSRTLSAIAGCDILLKLENLQYTGSFKDRGALIKLLSLSEAERAAGVIAVSAGNHAQGVAYHAERLCIPATIVMPEGTPFVKVRHTEAFGARVILKGEGLAEAAAFADELRTEEGLTLVHPYDDPHIIAGQGTIALEMIEADPALDTLVVPIGGGGLIAGIAVAAKTFRPRIEVVGVETELYPSMYQAIHGLPPTSGGQTIAEGIAVKTPGELTKAIVAEKVDDILLVGEAAIEHAVQLLIEIEKTVAEGAGAAPLAAVMANRERFAGKRVGLVVSGGNIDSRLLASVLLRGLMRDGRIVRLRVETRDIPGSLGHVARLIGEKGGNIVEIYHQRLFYDVPVKLAELDVVLETRDPNHVMDIIAALRAAGFPTRLLGNTARD
ncbi:MAG TPA: threonine ammonia-lyase [Alphaproteobacteria bacterium]